MSDSTPQPYSHKKIHAPLGARFGRWTVLCDDDGKKWICLCDCGTIRSVDAYTLRKGISLSCGCYKIEQTKKISTIDIQGQRFGHLIAIAATDKRSVEGTVVWLCQCDCGKSREVPLGPLRSGVTQSCGCLRGESKRMDLRARDSDG